MRRASLWLATILLGVLLGLASGGTALAATDENAPVLVDAYPAKASFAANDNVEYILVFDEPGGIDIYGNFGLFATFQLKSSPAPYATAVTITEGSVMPNGGHVTDITTQYHTEHPDSYKQGTVAIKLTVPMAYNGRANFTTGDYALTDLMVSDPSGNDARYSGEPNGDLLAFPGSATRAFHIVNDGADVIPPIVKSVAFDRKTVSVGETLKLTVKAYAPDGIPSDFGLGYTLWLNDIRLPQSNYQYYPNASCRASAPDGAGIVTVTASTVIPITIPPGIYHFGQFMVRDIVGNESYNGYGDIFDGLEDISVTIQNPGYQYSKAPTIESFTISSASAKPGETVTFTVNVADHGAALGPNANLYIFNSKGTNIDTPTLMRSKSDGLYRLNYTLPANLVAEDLSFDISLFAKDGSNYQVNWLGDGGDAPRYFPKLHVGTVFSGLDDITLLAGSDSTDLLAGVTASNNYEGTIDPARIRVANPPDFTKAGVYLMRLEASSTLPTTDQNGCPTPENKYYIGYRWVGITDQLPVATGDPFVTADKSLSIGASKEEVSIRADVNGRGLAAVPYAASYTAPGNYEVAKTGAVPDNKVAKTGATQQPAQKLSSAPSVLRCRISALSRYTIAARVNNARFGTVAGGGGFASGASVKLVATPKAGCLFVHWLIGGKIVSTSPTYTFTANGSRAVKAVFMQKPGTPVVKAVPAGYASISITWGKVAGATEYELYRATSKTGAYSKIKSTTGLSCTDTGRTTGTTYYYKVHAVNVTGTIRTAGGDSAIVSAAAVPARPGSFKAVSASYSSIKLSWGKVNGATGYQVYRATNKNGAYKPVKETTGTSYTNTSLTAGKTYYYKVRAYHLEGKAKVYGSFTAIITGKPIPATPGSVKAKRASSTSIRVSWSKISGATGYQVYRATTKNGKYTLVKDTKSQSYTNTKLGKKRTYYYQVRAYRTVSGKKVPGSFSSVKYAKT